MPSPPHDRALLDAVAALPPEPFAGEVWRVVRAGRDPLLASRAPGRWTPPEGAEVLYTSLTEAGALAEIGYRLSLEPIWPSRIAHTRHRIALRVSRTLRLPELAALAPLGVDVARFAGFDYRATQAIAAAAEFLEFDGMVVPSARADCLNLVLFADRPGPEAPRVADSAPVDWAAWRAAAGR